MNVMTSRLGAAFLAATALLSVSACSSTHDAADTRVAVSTAQPHGTPVTAAARKGGSSTVSTTTADANAEVVNSVDIYRKALESEKTVKVVGELPGTSEGTATVTTEVDRRTTKSVRTTLHTEKMGDVVGLDIGDVKYVYLSKIGKWMKKPNPVQEDATPTNNGSHDGKAKFVRTETRDGEQMRVFEGDVFGPNGRPLMGTIAPGKVWVDAKGQPRHVEMTGGAGAGSKSWDMTWGADLQLAPPSPDELAG